MKTFLSVEDVAFHIGDKPILSDIHCQLTRGQIATLLGPSGCGKTSLLRLIAGFVAPTRGQIVLDGEVISRPHAVLAPEKRGVGMVFQDYALFPHLSVFDNIVFGLKNTDKANAKQRVSELLEMVGLSGVEARYPHELSGGQQQRIAIARAVAPRPRLLLLDEPFASLDTNLRERLVRDLGILLKYLNIATLLVTHDQREAFAVSEYVGMMSQGRILQWDKPFNLYHNPINPTVANFVGQGVMVKAKVVTPHAVDSALGIIESQVALFESIGEALCVLVRPDDIVEDKNSPLVASVLHKFFHGASTLYELDFNGVKLVANLNSHADYNAGDCLHFAVRAEHLVTFSRGCKQCVC